MWSVCTCVIWISLYVLLVTILHSRCTVKISVYPYIHGYFLWRVFHILTEPVPYTFVSVNRRNNKAQVHTSSIYRYKRIRNRFVKIWKTRHKMSVEIDGYFFTVCTQKSQANHSTRDTRHSFSSKITNMKFVSDTLHWYLATSTSTQWSWTLVIHCRSRDQSNINFEQPIGLTCTTVLELWVLFLVRRRLWLWSNTTTSPTSWLIPRFNSHRSHGIYVGRNN